MTASWIGKQTGNMKLAWLKKSARVGGGKPSRAMGTALLLSCSWVSSGAQTGGGVIQLPPIDAALERKQLYVDMGGTQAPLLNVARKAFKLHGGYREVPPGKGHYSFEFALSGPTGVNLRVSRGTPRQVVSSRVFSGTDWKEAMFRACDSAVLQTLKIPGFFSGRLAFVSDRSRSKEIWVGDAMLSSASPKTNFRKTIFNTSWDATGSGVFFTSNRKVINCVEHLNLSDGKITNVASYRGGSLRGSQNPRDGRLALILSTTGNPELWLADSIRSKPRRITRNKSNESGPCWSPDGRRLIVTSDAMGKAQLYQVSLSSGKLTRISTNVSRHCAEATWNPLNPNLVAFTAAAGGFQTAVYDFSTGKSRILTGGSGDCIQPCWTNDGRHLICVERHSNGKQFLVLLDAESTQSPVPRIRLHDERFGNCRQPGFHYPRS